MAKAVSKTQIDRLGDRLRKGNISEDDLRLLDSYRRSFSDAYEFVVGKIRKDLLLEPTGRPTKSTISIIEKLRRESIRLTQLQDIAGCRLTVPDIIEQNKIVQGLAEHFEQTTIIDRRQQLSPGYRAVHVIVNQNGKLIEIQVRTVLQHLWAELSEKFSDVIDPAIKYGGGKEIFQTVLIRASLSVAAIEMDEPRLAGTQQSLVDLNHSLSSNEEKQQLVNLQEQLESSKKKLFQFFHDSIEWVENSRKK